MKLKLIFLTLLFAFTSAFAAENHTANTNSDENKKDGEILGWVVVVDKNEIAAAGLALHRKLNTMVEQYAAFLKKEHTANLQEAAKLGQKTHITPTKSSKSEDLHKDGEKMAADLKKLNDQDFQKTYIEDMVKGHEAVLKQIDDYIDDVKNPEVKAFLEKTRNHVKVHLEKAKAIQEKMKSNA